MYKLTYIKVEGLPSLGPQEITLSLDHSVYFIMGANGTGKTTILNIINYCFEQKWDKLLEIQFEKITLSFEGENNKKFFLKKDGASLILSPDSNFVEENKLKIDLSSEHSKEQLISIALKFKKIKTLPCGHWSTTSSSKDDQNFIHMKSPEKVLEYLSGLEEILPDIQHFIGDDSIITDFANTLIQEDIFFISTNRMQKIPKYRNNNQQIWLKDLNRYITNKINVDIDEMSDDISGIYEKYNTIVRNNQLTLINELQSNVEGLDQNSLSETGNAEEIYQQYQESIKSFEKIGITLETTIKTPNFDSPYIAITTKLLEIFNTSYQENFEDKIKYFIAFFDFIRKAIPTKNFSFKNNRIFISPRRNPELEIQPENLSSGEQQLVILGYDILSSCNKNSLVLIDEPEISMDPAMKAEFVEFLSEAAELRNSRYLLATHSHMVIGSKRDEVQILNWEGNV